MISIQMLCNLQVKADGYETASCRIHLPRNAAATSSVCAMMSMKQSIEKYQTVAFICVFSALLVTANYVTFIGAQCVL